MSSRSVRVAVALASILVFTTSLAGPAAAQQDGPEERSPVDGIAGVPVGEVCALQGTLVLVETVARSNLPPELLRAMVETLSVPFQTACTLVPPRDRLTRCAGDREVNETTQGLVGAAPVGDAVQIIEEIESAAGLGDTASQALVDALACERFEFGQGDPDAEGEVFVPPTRPDGTAPTTTSSPDPIDPPTNSGPPDQGDGVSGIAVVGGGETSEEPVADGDEPDEIAAPASEDVASISDQIDLFAVLVCLVLLGATMASLAPDGRVPALVAAVRRRGTSGTD